MKKAFPNLVTYSFAGMGHGEFVMDAENFIKAVEDYMKDNNIVEE